MSKGIQLHNSAPRKVCVPIPESSDLWFYCVTVSESLFFVCFTINELRLKFSALIFRTWIHAMIGRRCMISRDSMTGFPCILKHFQRCCVLAPFYDRCCRSESQSRTIALLFVVRLNVVWRQQHQLNVNVTKVVCGWSPALVTFIALDTISCLCLFTWHYRWEIHCMQRSRRTMDGWMYSWPPS